MVNSVTFNFTRISTQNMLPLVSRLLISPVRDALNGTLVNCTDVETSEYFSIAVHILVINESITQGIESWMKFN